MEHTANKTKNLGEVKEILYDGYFYDVTDFIRKHPGGTVIEYYTEKGEDGTHAIQQFHNRSIEKVRMMMNALKKRPATDSELGLDAKILEKNRRLTEDFTKLHYELEREGYFKPSYMHAFLRVMELFVLAAIGLGLFFHDMKLIGIFVITLSRGRTAFLQHEIGHLAYSGNPKVDRLVQVFLQGLFIGLSGTRWRRQHNRHHAMPQRLKHDVDLDTMPLLAHNPKVLNKSEQGIGFMIRNQVYLFVVDSLLVGLVWQFYQDPKFIFRRRNYLELAFVIVHFVIFYHLGFWFWLMSTWFGTFYLLITFSLNHTFLPVTTEPTHWVEYSLIHTADVAHTPWHSWWLGYLNYQIEHHLFPTMPNFQLPYIQSRVKALAEKHNLPYTIHSYPEALWKVFKNLSDVSKDLKGL